MDTAQSSNTHVTAATGLPSAASHLGQMLCMPLSTFSFPVALVPSCAEEICLKKSVLFFFRESINANILACFTKQVSYRVKHKLKSNDVTCAEAVFCVALNTPLKLKIHRQNCVHFIVKQRLCFFV